MKKLTLTAIALVAVVSTGASAREVDSQGQRIFDDWSYSTDERPTSGSSNWQGDKPVDQQVIRDQRRQQWENATPEQKKQMRAKHQAHKKAAAAKTSAAPAAAKPATTAKHHHHHKKAAAPKSALAPAETPPGNQ